ncbi:hypothetical protein J2W97_001987 [Paenibacillus jamilae]|nr:hypothetical protein [Paenibacillus jamilae]
MQVVNVIQSTAVTSELDARNGGFRKPLLRPKE